MKPTHFLLAAALLVACSEETHDETAIPELGSDTTNGPVPVPEIDDSEVVRVGDASSTFAMHDGPKEMHALDTDAPPASVHYEVVTANFSPDEQEIFDLTNEERAQYGLDPLTSSDYLSQLAKAHSENMANGTVSFGHDGFDNRVDKVWGKIGGGAIGENCAYNWSGGADAVDQWMNSTGHRENILDDSYTLIGIGVAVSRDGAYYCTQIFLSK